jgi:hypothetical protein
MMMRRILLIGLCLLSLFHGSKSNDISIKNGKKIAPEINPKVIPSCQNISRCMNEAWDVSWKRFYSPKTQLFYDYLISYKHGQELSHIPSVDEVLREYPNSYGYGTGMEDCMISAGIMLCMIIDRYAVTKDEKLRKYAYLVYQGIKRCATVHGIPGFLARGICIQDQKSYYIGSSRDQYTHAVHGLWYYFNSPLCNSNTKIEIGEILSEIADRMKRNVIPENDYDFLRADGSRDPRGISRMWNVQGHEVARLPMIYAAAWNATGNNEYYKLYRYYIKEAVMQSFNVEDNTTTYALLQMQCSFELLKSMEQDPLLKKQMNEIMTLISRLVYNRAINANKVASTLNLTMLTTDWRNGVGLKTGSEYRKIWYCVRESGEAALTQLIDLNDPFPEEQKSLLIQAITRLNYRHVSTSGIFYLQGAYWKARKLNISGF